MSWKDFGAIWDDCPKCGNALDIDGYASQSCICGWENDTDEDDYSDDDEEMKALEKAAFGGHEDVWIEVDGHQQRVLGDPNMSEETKKALAGLIKAATEAVERGDFDND
jgi:hypothetical protein